MRFEEPFLNVLNTAPSQENVSLNRTGLSFDPGTLLMLAALSMFALRYQLRVRTKVFTVMHGYVTRHLSIEVQRGQSAVCLANRNTWNCFGQFTDTIQLSNSLYLV
jgi:hypothetical protein